MKGMYRIIDGSSKHCGDVKVYAPDGTDLTNKATEYTIMRRVGSSPIVLITLIGPVDPETMELTHEYLAGPVVCEITKADAANA